MKQTGPLFVADVHDDDDQIYTRLVEGLDCLFLNPQQPEWSIGFLPPIVRIGNSLGFLLVGRVEDGEGGYVSIVARPEGDASVSAFSYEIAEAAHFEDLQDMDGPNYRRIDTVPDVAPLPGSEAAGKHRYTLRRLAQVSFTAVMTDRLADHLGRS